MTTELEQTKGELVTLHDPGEYDRLHRRWREAQGRMMASDSVKNANDEQEAWDALVDYVEAHELNYTSHDPRGSE